MIGEDLAGRLCAVHAWHPQIHQHDIRFQSCRLLDHLGAICRLTNQGDSRVLFQKAGKTPPKEGLVVGDQDAGGSFLGDQLSASFGSLAMTVVPRKLRLRIVSSPPISEARSRMPTIPMPS